MKIQELFVYLTMQIYFRVTRIINPDLDRDLLHER